ncbi:VOC family protein [Catenulispora yoronensis]|uniref:VOC family protein n=1 Tax=Catenulispora yoronensis TaxID=450799 RepID=A0ABP5GE84_9ACTN
MTVHTTAHLNFHGEAREALEFYQSVFGGEVMVATYGDFGMPKDAPGAEHVVFGQVVGANGFRVMAYDVPGEGERTPGGETTRVNGLTMTTERFFLSVRGDSVEEIAAHWEKLRNGATVIQDFGPSQWAPGFGMLTDRFGTTWILDVESGY